MTVVHFTAESIDAVKAGARALRFLKEANEELHPSYDGSGQQANIDELEELASAMAHERQDTIERNIAAYGQDTVRVDHAPLRAVSALADNDRHSVKAPDAAVVEATRFFTGARFERREHPFGIGGDQ